MIEKIRTGMDKPDKIPPWFAKKINEIYRRRRGMSQPSEGYNTNGFCIFSENWDNLIILDACRYDFFKKYIDMPGNLDSRISRGSATKEWAKGNFHGQNRLDTVYVSHNSWPLKVREVWGDDYREIFHFESVSVGKRQKTHLRDYCHHLSSRALELQREYPHKRLILHYIPPHLPFVDTNGNIVLDAEKKSLHELKKDGKGVRHKDFKQAYSTSVQYILDHIRPVIEELEGKTVISADHGELLRERMFPIPIRRYSHHPGLYLNELIKVPWFTSKWDKRKKVHTETEPSPESEARKRMVSTKEINERLRDLGYKV